MPTGPQRSLADQLRGWSDEQLATLLRRRPDLARPAPRDSTQLASRAATSASVTNALGQLDALELAVLDACVVVAGRGGATREQIVDVVWAPPDAAAAALDRLTEQALVWASPEGLRPLTTVADALAGTPAGPWAPSGCRPVTGLTDVEARLARLSDAGRALLRHVDEYGGEATTSARKVSFEDATSPAEEVLALDLLTSDVTGRFLLPGEVSIALRGGHTTRGPVGDAPAIATTERPPELVDRTAAGTAFEVVRRVELLGDRWGADPPAMLRGGGVGVRDLRAAAALLQIDQREAGLLVELAGYAGLIGSGVDRAGNPVWLPAAAFDRWAATPPAERWTRLAQAWLETPRAPGLLGSKDRGGKSHNALGSDLVVHTMRETRRMTLAALAGLEPGQALASGTGLPSLVAHLEWQRPRRRATRGQLVAWTVEEARMLGVLGLDAMSRPGRALLTDDAAAVAEALGPLLPEPVDHILLQADLTAVAPGPLEPGLANDLHLVADVESRGGATVYRFSGDSIRRAFDAGWSAAEVHAFLTKASRTPVPQPLHYLVDDTARRFGTIRLGHAEAFIRADDETALAELLHHPQAAAWGLRSLAPTVLISSTPLDVLLPRLRDLGLAPVVEAPDGSVHVARPDQQRGKSFVPDLPAGAAQARIEADISAVVAAVRAGDRAAAQAPRRGPLSPADTLSLLREAIETHSDVVIEYVDSGGTRTSRVVTPQALGDGRLTAFDQRIDFVQHFAVHRITGATLVE